MVFCGVLCRALNTVRTVSKYKIKVVERGKINTPNTQIHERSFSPFLMRLIILSLRESNLQRDLSALSRGMQYFVCILIASSYVVDCAILSYTDILYLILAKKE
jgi:hypothetical protein